jgi:hypothetical protein
MLMGVDAGLGERSMRGVDRHARQGRDGTEAVMVSAGCAGNGRNMPRPAALIAAPHPDVKDDAALKLSEMATERLGSAP